MGKNRKKSHSVYVVELAPEVRNRRKFARANPDADPEKRCLYVGMTGLSPKERFKNHLRGHKASKYVKKYGMWHRWKMFDKYNPMTRRKAKRFEVKLAERPREKGHAVWQK